MSITATALFPLMASLPPEELEVLIAHATKMLPKNHKPTHKPKRDVYENIPEIFHPHNKEALIQQIMSGN